MWHGIIIVHHSVRWDRKRFVIGYHRGISYSRTSKSPGGKIPRSVITLHLHRAECGQTTTQAVSRDDDIFGSRDLHGLVKEAIDLSFDASPGVKETTVYFYGRFACPNSRLNKSKISEPVVEAHLLCASKDDKSVSGVGTDISKSVS